MRETLARILKCPGKIWYNFVVLNFAIPNFAYSKSPPVMMTHHLRPKHGGHSGADPDTNTIPNLLGPPRAAVPSTPTYIPQNDPLAALIILNTHMWGF